MGFSKRKDLPLGWQIITEFHLSQNPGGKNILEGFSKKLKKNYSHFLKNILYVPKEKQFNSEYLKMLLVL